MRHTLLLFFVASLCTAQPQRRVEAPHFFYSYTPETAKNYWNNAWTLAAPDTEINVYIKRDFYLELPANTYRISVDSIRGRGAAREAMITRWKKQPAWPQTWYHVLSVDSPRTRTRRIYRAVVLTPGTNIQIYIHGLNLQARKDYTLHLTAAMHKDTSQWRARIFIQRHTAPYTSYGMNGAMIVPGSWLADFTLPFRTPDTPAVLTDTRIRIDLTQYAPMRGGRFELDAASLRSGTQTLGSWTFDSTAQGWTFVNIGGTGGAAITSLVDSVWVDTLGRSMDSTWGVARWMLPDGTGPGGTVWGWTEDTLVTRLRLWKVIGDPTKNNGWDQQALIRVGTRSWIPGDP